MTSHEERIVRACEEIYAETSAFYAQMKERLRNPLGYKILYGPPLSHAPVLFIAHQPGGRKEPEAHLRERERWPTECEYATARWHLAARLQKMFPVGFLDLASCVATNTIFFRAPNLKSYYTMTVDQLRRVEIAQFCGDRVKRLINLLEPQSIVYIGFNAADGGSQPDLVSPKGRVLAKTCEVAGRQAAKVLHLSGARISNEDRALIGEYILDRIPRKRSGRRSRRTLG
jgi:hypothetical protein